MRTLRFSSSRFSGGLVPVCRTTCFQRTCPLVGLARVWFTYIRGPSICGKHDSAIVLQGNDGCLQIKVRNRDLYLHHQSLFLPTCQLPSRILPWWPRCTTHWGLAERLSVGPETLNQLIWSSYRKRQMLFYYNLSI